MKIKLLTFLLFAAICTSASAQSQFMALDKTSRFGKKLGFTNPLSGNSGDRVSRRRYATNANRPGIAQLGIGYGALIGGATLTIKDSAETIKEVGVGLTYNIGLRAQIGISELMSLGLYVRKDIGTYITEFDDFDLNGASFGFEAKVYPINNDMFAVYVAPSVGYSFANSNINSDYPGKGSGLSYGITAGINWYWTEGFGMSADIGYAASKLSGKFNDVELKGMKYNITYGGLYYNIGLVVKFGVGEEA